MVCYYPDVTSFVFYHGVDQPYAYVRWWDDRFEWVVFHFTYIGSAVEGSYPDIAGAVTQEGAYRVAFRCI